MSDVGHWKIIHANVLNDYTVLIAFTNHALDHMLESVLEAGITNKIVRLGSRSANERIAAYNLTEMEKIGGNHSMQQSLNREYGKMMNAEQEMAEVLESIQLPTVLPHQIVSYLNIHYADAGEMFEEPPHWVRRLMEVLQADAEENGEWKTASNKKKDVSKTPTTPYGFWAAGMDLDYLEAEPAPEQEDERVMFFRSLGYMDIPPAPKQNRQHLSIEQLADTSVWLMSRIERKRLSRHWTEEVRAQAYQDNLDEFKDLRQRYDDLCQNYNNIKDQVARLHALSTRYHADFRSRHDKSCYGIRS